MSPFKSILAATDFSAAADQAVRRAALLAQQHGARLRVVHVVNPARLARLRQWVSPRTDAEPKVDDARDQLQRLAAELTSRFGVAAELQLRIGGVVEQLQRVSPRADLLVIGQRRRHALAEIVRGNTAQRLVEHCRRPVLVVKQAAGHAYRRALVPIDFTPASDAAAFVAAALSPEIDLQVFHAYASTGETVMREADVCESVIRDCRARHEAALMARMRRSMTRLGLDGRALSFALGRGSPVKATLRQAQALGADVLVATKQRQARRATSVLGNINGLLLRSHCDVLIVSGWVRDPRQAQAAAARWPATHSPAAGSPQAAWAAGVAAGVRGPSRTAARPNPARAVAGP